MKFNNFNYELFRRRTVKEKKREPISTTTITTILLD